MHVLLRRTLGRCAKGFTIVELMVAIAVAAILLVIAVPSFTNAINSNRLKSTANTLIGSLKAARMAAVQRNLGVQFCSNSTASNTSDALGTACGTNTGAVFALPSPSASTAIPLQVSPSELSISSIQIHGNIAAIRFNGQGLGFAPGASTPFSGVVADVCSTSLSTSNHIQVNMAAGGSVITTTSSTGACP
jgi:type IV fimbrial biogenesis protein FimT